MESVARYHSITFLADARLGNLLFTSLARTCMAGHFALMLSTWQEFVTFVLAYRDWISTCSSLSTNKRLDGVASTWAVSHSLWLEGAGFARSLMTSSLAFMFATIKQFTADLATFLLWFATIYSVHFLSTEA
jgi:hypothetical protein